MRNMIQLLGGVAVAGAVAAGTTAFTASGLTSTVANPSVVGGTFQQNVVGAEMTAVSFTVDSTPGKEGNVTGVNLTLQGASSATLPVNSTVKAIITGAVGNGADATITCTHSGGGGIWNCPVVGQPAKYFTAVTDLDVSVVTP